VLHCRNNFTRYAGLGARVLAALVRLIA
jgi:hypothetical protein